MGGRLRPQEVLADGVPAREESAEVDHSSHPKCRVTGPARSASTSWQSPKQHPQTGGKKSTTIAAPTKAQALLRTSKRRNFSEASGLGSRIKINTARHCPICTCADARGRALTSSLQVHHVVDGHGFVGLQDVRGFERAQRVRPFLRAPPPSPSTQSPHQNEKKIGFLASSADSFEGAQLSARENGRALLHGLFRLSYRLLQSTMSGGLVGRASA